jgi:nitroimidazol reductase NimA-like FMN-containing flavoprotein (pyridoxamine 5'-phosphate oxidase superfamily)
MLEKMKALAKQKNICVLATVTGNKPYCSLMAYVTDDLCREIYMVTYKDTNKYRNLAQNPCVSLLIDTRENRSRNEAQALTVEGTYMPLENEAQKKEARMRLLATHPHLKDFFDRSGAEIIRIKINSFLLLDGLHDAHFETI